MPPDYAAMIAPHASRQLWRCLKCDARDDGTLMAHARACPERGEDTPERFACVYIIVSDPIPSED